MGELCQYRRSGCRRPHSYDQPDAESYEHAAENSVDQYFIGFDMPRFRHPQEERHEEHNEYRVVHGAFAQKFKRSEEHTSELQSRFDLVCRLLLEKKKRLKKNSIK